jgi:hypothetical protein
VTSWAPAASPTIVNLPSPCVRAHGEEIPARSPGGTARTIASATVAPSGSVTRPEIRYPAWATMTTSRVPGATSGTTSRRIEGPAALAGAM